MTGQSAIERQHCRARLFVITVKNGPSQTQSRSNSTVGCVSRREALLARLGLKDKHKNTINVKNKPIPSREPEHHTTDIVIVDYFKEVRGRILSSSWVDLRDPIGSTRQRCMALISSKFSDTIKVQDTLSQPRTGVQKRPPLTGRSPSGDSVGADKCPSSGPWSKKPSTAAANGGAVGASMELASGDGTAKTSTADASAPPCEELPSDGIPLRRFPILC